MDYHTHRPAPDGTRMHTPGCPAYCPEPLVKHLRNPQTKPSPLREYCKSLCPPALNKMRCRYRTRSPEREPQPDFPRPLAYGKHRHRHRSRHLRRTHLPPHTNLPAHDSLPGLPPPQQKTLHNARSADLRCPI